MATDGINLSEILKTFDNPFTTPTREEMPAFWPEDRPPQRLRPGYIYKGVGKRWYHLDDTLANRAERRRAGVSHG